MLFQLWVFLLSVKLDDLDLHLFAASTHRSYWHLFEGWVFWKFKLLRNSLTISMFLMHWMLSIHTTTPGHFFLIRLVSSIAMMEAWSLMNIYKAQEWMTRPLSLFYTGNLFIRSFQFVNLWFHLATINCMAYVWALSHCPLTLSHCG